MLPRIVVTMFYNITLETYIFLPIRMFSWQRDQTNCCLRMIKKNIKSLFLIPCALLEDGLPLSEQLYVCIGELYAGGWPVGQGSSRFIRVHTSFFARNTYSKISHNY